MAEPDLDGMGFDLSDQTAAPDAPVEEDRATRARGGADNFFTPYIKGDEQTYGETSNLRRAKDVGTAHFYADTTIGAAEANMQAHPATTGQEMFGLDPRAGLTPDEARFAQRQDLMRAYEDYARSRTNENNVDVTDAQLAQIRSALYPDATNIGAAAADVVGGLAGGSLSPEVAFAPEVKAAEAVGLVARPAVGAAVDAVQLAGTSGREALARYLNSGVSAVAANTAINPVTQSFGTSAGLQPSYDPLQTAEAPITGFVGGVVLHGVGEGAHYVFDAGRKLVNRMRGQADGGAAQRATAELAAETPAFRPQSGSGPDAASPLPAQPAAETSAQVEQSASQAAPDTARGTPANTPQPAAAQPQPASTSATAEPVGRPAPVSVPVTSFDRTSILAAYGDGNGGIDMGAASQAIGQQVETALGEGKAVTYRVENKDVPIVAVEGGRLKDADGQTWGLQQVLQPRPGDQNRIDIAEKPSTPQTPQDAPGAASGHAIADRAGNAASGSRSEPPQPMRPADIAADVPGTLRGGEIDAKRFSAPPTVEELDRIIAGGRAHDEAEADRVFGADAAEAKRLMRSRSDAAHDKLAGLVEKHGPEAEAVVYGMHDRGVVVDEDMRALRDAIGNMDHAVDLAAERGDTSDLSREMAWIAPKLPDIAADAVSHTSEQRIAVLTLAKAVEDMRAKGIDPEPVLRGAVDYTVQRTRGDGDDAEVLLGRLAGYAKEYMRAPDSAARRDTSSALPAPASTALPAPDRRSEVVFRGQQPPRVISPAIPALPDGPNASEIMSLQRQSFDLAEKLGVPLRQGRIQSSKAAAQFNTRYGIARTRDVADFYAVAHEAGGHAIEQKVGKPITDLIASNATLLGKMDYDPTLQRPEEGFAEFMALSLTNPKAAQTAHPNLYADIRQAIGNARPDLLHALDEAAETYQRYLAAPSGVKVAANIVDGEKHGFVTRALHQIHEDGLPATIGTWLGQAYTAMVAENYPLMKAVRDLTRGIQEKQGGGLVSLPASRDPAKLIRLFGSAKNGALTQLRWGVVPYREVEAVGHSMYDAINHAAGGPSVLGRLNRETTADLSSYMVAKRASNLWDRYTAGALENPPVAFSKADAVQAMTDLLAKNPRLDEAAMMAHDFTRNMLAKQRDAGIITSDLHDTLAQDPFYVPLFRDVSDKPLAGKAGGGSSQDGPGLTDTIKRLRGSSRDIIDPIQGIMMQTLLAERTIRHNDIVRSLADLGDRAGEFGNGVVEPVKAKELRGTTFDLAEQVKTVARQRGTDPNDTALLMQSLVNAFGDDPIMGTMFKMDVASKRGEPIMFYKEAGELRAVRFSHSSEGLALYETLGSLPQAPADLYTAVMRTGTRLLRTGVVSHPTFVLANYVKDQISVGILRNDYIPLLSGLPGLWDEMRQGPASKLYAYLGGMSAGTATSGIREAESNDIAQIAKRGYGAIHVSSLEGLMELTQITEAATRNSIFAKTYKQKLKQGLSPIDAAIEGAYQGTDILDFGQHGSRMMALRAFIPFINPHIQGLNKAATTMLVPLARLARGDILTQEDREAAANAGWALGKFAALGGTLGAVWAALNWDREEYRDATPEQKAMNFVAPIGDKVYRMPKPFELGLGFTAGEYAYAKLMGDDPRAARQFMAAAWEVLKPPDPIAGNPFIKSYVESETGTSLFTGRSIVPENLQGVAPQAQYNEKTSGIARRVSDTSAMLARVLNDLTGSSVDAWSPMLVDNVIGNLGGYLGKEVQINSKFLLDQANGPEQRFEDAAFFKRFTLDPNKWSTTVQDYYGFAGQKGGAFPQAANTVQHLIDMGHKQDAADFMATLSDEQKAYVTLQTAGDQDGKRAFTADERRLNPITRAQSAVKALSDFSHEMIGNRQANTETGEHIDMTPAQLRTVNDAVLQMAAMEMRNALVMTNDPGYKGRQILDLKPQLDVIRAASPEAADEIARRYATNRVLPADTVAREWPNVRAQLLSKGSDADLADAMVDATLGGYEFGGERVKRRQKRREVVPGRELEAVP